MAVFVYVLVHVIIPANPAGIASGKAMDKENTVEKLYGRGFKAKKETRTCYVY